ncbi:MFS transporter [Streptomyces malaysiensis]|uniref:MFS transporter n=1 Tax=Streptomyces malaysiensis TaxID=92644 RepID=UPI002B2A5CFD|nr:MFS transporter [Streptomyces malaysiensis]
MQPANRQLRRRAVIAAAIGNFITWFDFAAYGFLAVTLGKVFFPSQDPTLSLLSTFAVFGVAFLMEPVGAFFFGRLGDRIGRKAVLATVILLMSLSTFTVGLLPGYETIGVSAPVLLLVMRLLQGFAAGGEPGGAATFLAEYSEQNKRAQTVSMWHASSYLSNAGASLLILGLNAGLSAEAMLSWGWRVPFLIAAPVGLVGLFVRLKLSDTPEFERLKESGEVSHHPVRDALTGSWKQILQVFGCGALQYAAFYFTNIYMETYIHSELGYSEVSAAVSTVVCLAVASVGIFVFARISDRVGRRPILRIATICSALFTFPMFLVINSGSLPAVILGHTLLGICLAMFMSASGAALVEIFPSRVRYAGFSIGFNMAGAVFGGTAPYLATALIAGTGSSLSPAFILIGTAVIALIAITTMRETAGPKASVAATADVARS